MNRFKVVASIHEHSDGRTYKTGEVIETDIDLDSLFAGKFQRIAGPTRFSRDRSDTADEAGKVTDIDGLEPEAGRRPAVVAKRRPVTSVVEEAADAAEADAEAEASDDGFGDDVTANVTKAEGLGVLVFKGTGGYTVVDENAPAAALNEEPIKNKKELEKFLASFQSQ